MRFGEFLYERDKRFDIRPDKRVGEEIGIPSRSAVGMNVLPGNLSIEIEAIFELYEQLKIA